MNTIRRESALEGILRGIDTLASFVRATSGSRGRTFIIRTPDGDPYVTKDGVTIAKAIASENHLEDLGCRLLQQVAQRTVDEVGDGTTLTIILCHELIKRVFQATTPAHDLIRHLSEVTDFVTEYIRSQAKPIESKEQLIHIASISTSSQEYGVQIGSLIYDIYPEGIVNVEEGDDGIVSIVREQSHVFQQSYPFSFLLGKSKSVVRYSNPFIAFFKERLEDTSIVSSLIEKSIERSRPLIFFVPEVSSTIVELIHHHHQSSGLRALPLIYDEEYKDDLLSIIQDENVSSIEVSRTAFKIFSKGITDTIRERVAILKSRLKWETSPYMKDRLEVRIASLLKKVTTIYVDAPSKAQSVELKDRIEDGILASRSAMEMGYVLGGGLTLYNASQLLLKKFPSLEAASILSQVLKAPMFQIISNAQFNPDISRIGKEKGFNATTYKIENFYKAGIIDPAKVLIHALRNALSAAIAITNINGVIIHHGRDKIPQFQEGRGFVEKSVM